MPKQINAPLVFDLDSHSYTPVHLIEKLKEELMVTSNYALSRLMEVQESVVSRVYNRKTVISSSFLVRVCDLTGWHMSKVRELAGLPATFLPWKYRVISSAEAKKSSRQSNQIKQSSD